MARMQITARLPAEMVGMIDGLALSEDRTFSQTVERLLKSALGAGLGVPGVGEAATETADVEPPRPAPSADRIAAAGTDGKSSHTTSPPTRAAARRGASRRASPPAGSTPEFRPDFKGGK